MQDAREFCSAFSSSDVHVSETQLIGIIFSIFMFAGRRFIIATIIRTGGREIGSAWLACSRLPAYTVVCCTYLRLSDYSHAESARFFVIQTERYGDNDDKDKDNKYK